MPAARSVGRRSRKPAQRAAARTRRAPGHQRESLRLRGKVRLTLRPVAIDDLKQAESFFSALSEQSRYFRYLRAVPRITPELILASVTSRTEPSVIVVATVAEAGIHRLVAGGRIESAEAPLTHGRKPRMAEFALSVVDAWQGRGVGAALLRSLCRRARAMGYTELVGDVLAANAPMLALAERLGFRRRPGEAPEVVRVGRALPRVLDFRRPRGGPGPRG